MGGCLRSGCATLLEDTIDGRGVRVDAGLVRVDGAEFLKDGGTAMGEESGD